MLPIQLIFCIAITALLSIAIVSSIKEKLLRASLISIAALLANTTYWLSLMYFRGTHFSQILTIASVIAIGLFAILSLIKYFPASSEPSPADIPQYDERDNMFFRNNLKHHPDLARKYYDANPDLESIDRTIADKTELGAPGSRFYDKYLTPIASAAFAFLARSRHFSQGQAEPKKTDIDIDRFTAVLRKTAILYGAVDLGITKLKPHHLYSNAGRHAENYGHRDRPHNRHHPHRPYGPSRPPYCSYRRRIDRNIPRLRRICQDRPHHRRVHPLVWLRCPLARRWQLSDPLRPYRRRLRPRPGQPNGTAHPPRLWPMRTHLNCDHHP